MLSKLVEAIMIIIPLADIIDINILHIMLLVEPSGTFKGDSLQL